MKNEKLQKFAVVKEDAAPAFENRLNELLETLTGKSPQVRFAEHDSLCAYISYTETRTITESLEDEMHLSGIRYKCEDCPYFRPILKKDGSVDERIKYGECPNAEFGRTYKQTEACETLLRQIRSGEVRLCLV